MNKINPMAAIKDGWRLTKEHFIVSLGLVLAYMAISLLMGFFPTEGFMGTITMVLNFFIEAVWTLGLIRIAVDVVDGEEPRFGAFGEVMPRLGHYIVMMVILAVIVLIPASIILAIGAATCGIALTTLASFDLSLLSTMWIWILLSSVLAIYICLRMFFAPYLLVDRNMGVVEAMKTSWKASEPIQGKILAFLLLSILIVIVGFLCVVVGVFVSAVILIYAQAHFYRQAFPAGLQDPLLVEDTNVVVQ